MNFGNIKSTSKIKNANIKKFDPIIVDNFNKDEKDYFIFLTDRVTTNPKIINNLRSDLKVIGINSYIVVSCIELKQLEKDPTDDLISLESKWRDYLKYNGKECTAIVAFGRAIRILNKSADIGYFDFTDDLFNKTRYFCGSAFVKGPDKWIYPVAPLDNIYPYEEMGNTADVVNYNTRIFRKQVGRLLSDDMSTKELDTRPIEILISDTDEKCEEYLKRLDNSELLALDTETSGFSFWKDSLGTVQLCNDGVKSYFFDWKLLQNHRRSLTKILRNAKRLTLANGKFDIRFLAKNGVRGVYPTDDTCLLSQVMNSYRPKGLKPGTWFWCGNIGGYDDALDMLKKKMKITDYLKIPFNILSEYAAMDPVSTWRQQVAMDEWCAHLDKTIPNEKIPEWTIYRFYKSVMIPNLCASIDIELNGVIFSREKFKKADEDIDEILNSCKEELSKLWNVPKNFEFSSTDKLGKLFESLKWPCVERNKKGCYSTSDATLSEYERLGCPGIPTLKKFRTFNVGKNTFLKGWGEFLNDEDDGTTRIHATCNSFGTTSLRHAMNDPNFQQIPANGPMSLYIKGLFVAPPSHEHYTVTDDNGKVWTNEDYCKLITKRGSILFEDLKEDDEIIDYDKSYTIYDHLPSPWYD
jgi:hypothetical protein